MARNKGHDNLIPQAHILTVGEQSAGGKASGVSRRNRKRIKEVADILLALPINSGDLIDIDDLQTITEDTNTDVITGITISLIKQALDGDLKAIQLLFTLTGEYSTRYNIHANADINRDESLIRLEEEMQYHFEFNRPKTAEELQADEERNENTTLMFKYYCMREDGNQVARNFTSDEQSKVQDLFNTADDELKVAFVRRCYGKDGKHLKETDCVTLFDNVYAQGITKGI